MLAGIPVAAELVEELADRVEEPAASALRTALEAGRATVASARVERSSTAAKDASHAAENVAVRSDRRLMIATAPTGSSASRSRRFASSQQAIFGPS